MDCVNGKAQRTHVQRQVPLKRVVTTTSAVSYEERKSCLAILGFTRVHKTYCRKKQGLYCDHRFINVDSSFTFSCCTTLYDLPLTPQANKQKHTHLLPK